MFNRTTSTLLSVSACLVLGSTGAWAGTLNGVTSSAALGANDFIDWGQLGPAFTQLNTPSNWVSNLGVTGEVGINASLIGTPNMERVDQNNGWSGNFTPGDHLIWNQGTNTGDGSIGVLPMSSLLSAIGANIQADFFGGFTATINAYDGMGNLLGSFSEAGTSTPNSDGSAIFIGLTDTDAEIAYATFSVVDVNGGNDLAINTVLINANGTAVPEPGSVAMLVGMGLSGAGFLIRKRNCRK